MNATDKAADEDALRNDTVLGREMEYFINRWHPTDPDAHARFVADLAVLIRRSAIDANAQVLMVYAQMAAMNPRPIYFGGPAPKGEMKSGG